MNSLTTVEWKLARADDHLNVLGDLIEAFVRPPAGQVEPYGAFTEEDQETGETVLRGTVAADPPLGEIGVIIGDALHNLRSGLDHLAWKLGGDPPPNPGQSEFPIFLDRDAFRGSQRGRSGYTKIEGLDDHAQAIIEDIQPFNGGQERHPLWLLHELSRQDKHRLPLLTGAVVEGAVHAKASGDNAVEIGLVDLGGALNVGPFEDRQVIGRWSPGHFSPEPKSHEDLGLFFDVAFSPEGPAPGMPVMDTLLTIREFIDGEVLPRLAPFG